MNEWKKPRTIFATLFYVSFLYLIVFKDAKVPDVLIAMVNLLMGFYFGQKIKTEGEKK